MCTDDLLPPSAVQVDADSSPDVLIDALAYGRFVSGEQPHARHAMIDQPSRDDVLRPAGGHCLRTVRRSSSASELWAGDGWTLLVERYSDGSAAVWAFADSATAAEAMISRATGGTRDRVARA